MKTLTPTDKHQPQQNALLAALATLERQHLAKDLELVSLTLGQALHESGETMSHAYFPIDCVVSLMYAMKNGESAEIAIVGSDGMIGIALCTGGESSMSREVVQNAGHAYRLKVQVLKDEFQKGGLNVESRPNLTLRFHRALTRHRRCASFVVALDHHKAGSICHDNYRLKWINLMRSATQQGISPLVPETMTNNNRKHGWFDKRDFIYNARRDEYRCPAGQRAIRRLTAIEGGLTLYRYWSSACHRDEPACIGLQHRTYAANVRNSE